MMQYFSKRYILFDKKTASIGVFYGGHCKSDRWRAGKILRQAQDDS